MVSSGHRSCKIKIEKKVNTIDQIANRENYEDIISELDTLKDEDEDEEDEEKTKSQDALHEDLKLKKILDAEEDK